MSERRNATSRPAVTPPLKWHGGKHYLADRIIALMPPHLHYVEPFAGGLAVLLAKDPEGVSEVVNDLNGSLINFWHVLRCPEMFPKFQRQVEATPFSEDHYGAAVEILRIHEEMRLDYTEERQIRWAVCFFIVCRQSLAGRMTAFAPLSRTRTRRGMNEQASAWLTTVEGLPAVHERLKRVVIVGPKDAKEVIRQQDGEQTLFYLDPPYLHETRASIATYAHEMSEKDHAQLLMSLSAIRGKFILSGYPSVLYEGAARCYGWRRQVFDLPNNSAGGKEKRRMAECVWMNYDL